MWYACQISLTLKFVIMLALKTRPRVNGAEVWSNQTKKKPTDPKAGLTWPVKFPTFWSIFNHFLRRQSFVNLTGNLWGLMLSCIFVVLTNVVLLKTSSCWMGFSHLNSQISLETCQIAFSPTSEQNTSQNWSYKFLCHRFFPVFGLSSGCQLWYDSISWYVHLIFEEFCWVSKACFADALFC